MSSYLIITDADTGQRLGAAKDALTAEAKAQAHEQRGHRVAVAPGPPVRELPTPVARDLPAGYTLLEPRRLLRSTLQRDPARWHAEALTFPEQWGRWGEGHLTANVAHACHDRGLIQIAVPLKQSKPFLYRRTPATKET